MLECKALKQHHHFSVLTSGRNEIWEPWIGPKHGPARATVQANLMNEKWLIEVVVTAACSKDYPEEEEEEDEKEEAEDKKAEADDKKMEE